MSFKQALSLRKPVRAFTKQPVSTEKITRILSLARCASLAANSQPWQVALVRGQAKQRWQQHLIEETKKVILRILNTATTRRW